MKAIVRREYGPPESLGFEEVPMPEVDGETDVIVKVRASSINAYDWHVLRGEPYLVRVKDGYRHPKTHGMGIDVAGTITAVGAKVTRFKVGDDVFGFAVGALAEYVEAAEAKLVAKPASMTFETAATLSCAGVTALGVLRDKAGVKPGQTVLVNGAAGGVGSFAVQIAKALGATVTAVCSTRNVERVRALGADEVVDYTSEDFSRRGKRYDVVVDAVGNRSLRALRRSLTPRGTLVVAGGGKGKWIGPLSLILKVLVVNPFVRQQLGAYMAQITSENLESLSALVESGAVVPMIDRSYSLNEAPEAIAYVEVGHARGKVVVTV